MSEKPLLLSSAKSGVIDTHTPWFKISLALVGVLMILVGATDVFGRLSNVLDSSRVSLAVGPAAAVDPSIILGTSQPVVPAALSIPSLGVHAKVEIVGKKADGTMGTPTDFKDVSWYSLGAKPGEPGNAVFAGHVNNALTTSGVFENLNKVKIGDKIQVSDKDGHTLTYVVTTMANYPANEAPAASIFAASGPSQIVLITCDGEWVSAERSFDKRLVVFAKLI